ncbi:hypothetical protein MTR_4g045617 [Medicago truncatula]|uniref:Uncharacterized protein n=1 Tax=Medicago truncatula TaxID=3880 RepID=A0A072UKE1_MEDTR|nr:hypothetical protein MTR_4g045617 [Medicago truncatula]
MAIQNYIQRWDIRLLIFWRLPNGGRLSSELEGDQERLLRLRGDLLGGDRLRDLLLVDLLVWLRDLTLIECRWDLEREWRGLLPLLIRVELLTSAPVGVASFGVSGSHRGPCRGLSWRGIICTGSSRGVPIG